MKLLRKMRASMRANPHLIRIRSFLPPLNFITVHYTYFITVCLISSLIFWGSSRPNMSISYTDSLFLVISAMTEAGLNTVNLSQMTLFQQIVLWVLIQMGSSILVSISTVLIRKRVFEQRFEGVVRRTKSVGRRSLSWRRSVDGVLRREGSREIGLATFDGAAGDLGVQNREIGKVDTARPDEALDAEDKPVDAQGTTMEKSEVPAQRLNSRTSHHHINDHTADPMLPSLSQAPTQANSQPRLNFVGVGSHPGHRSTSDIDTPGLTYRGRQNRPEDDEEGLDTSHYPTYLTRHTTGRNAQFHGLTKAERDHLGGVEYRAITLLAWIVPAYFILWQLIACIGLGAYMTMNRPNVARENGINPW